MTTLVAPLFVPGDRPDRFQKAAASGSDMIIIDLEDAVAPNLKDAARRSAAEYLSGGSPAVVRINAAGTAAFAGDLAALARARPSAVMVPKFEYGQANLVRQVLGDDLPIIALVETAAALRDLSGLLLDGNVVQAAVGTMDLATELGCTPESKTIEQARCLAVIASRIAGIAAPIDGITTTLDDAVAIEAAAREARAMGFCGKLCIHPRQVSHVLAAFVPTEQELAWARNILRHAGEGVGTVEGEMVDAPVIRRAQAILDRAPPAAI